MAHLTGIVLAGGKSSRMGKDKALLPWGNGILLEHTAGKLARICGEVVISSNNPEHRLYGYQVIPDLVPGLGPLSGIYSVISQSKTGRHLVLSVDLPMVNDGLLNYLAQLSADHPLVVPVHENGKFEPTCAVYGAELLPWLESLIQGEDFSLKSLFGLSFCWKIQESEYPEWFKKPAFVNLNTYSEYEKYRKRK